MLCSSIHDIDLFVSDIWGSYSPIVLLSRTSFVYLIIVNSCCICFSFLVVEALVPIYVIDVAAVLTMLFLCRSLLALCCGGTGLVFVVF